MLTIDQVFADLIFIYIFRLVYYLLECYRRCCSLLARESSTTLRLGDQVSAMQDLVLQNLVTAFREPDLYCDQQLTLQLHEVVFNSYELDECLLEVLDKFAFKMKVMYRRIVCFHIQTLHNSTAVLRLLYLLK